MQTPPPPPPSAPCKTSFPVPWTGSPVVLRAQTVPRAADSKTPKLWGKREGLVAKSVVGNLLGLVAERMMGNPLELFSPATGRP